MNPKSVAWGAAKFVGHVLIATYGVAIFPFGPCYAIAALCDPEGRALNSFFVSPSFLVPVSVGLAFGYSLGWKLNGLTLSLIPVPSLSLLAYGLYGNHLERQPWGWIVGQFFGPTTAADADYRRFAAQAMVVAPFFAAIAYTIGATFRRRSTQILHDTAQTRHRSRKKRAYTALAAALILTLGVLQRYVHRGDEVEFSWSASAGFERASILYPPASRFPKAPRYLRAAVVPLDEMIILEAKPQIAMQNKRMGLAAVSGCVGLAMLPVLPLPVVLGLDLNAASGCRMYPVDVAH